MFGQDWEGKMKINGINGARKPGLAEFYPASTFALVVSDQRRHRGRDIGVSGVILANP